MSSAEKGKTTQHEFPVISCSCIYIFLTVLPGRRISHWWALWSASTALPLYTSCTWKFWLIFLYSHCLDVLFSVKITYQNTVKFYFILYFWIFLQNSITKYYCYSCLCCFEDMETVFCKLSHVFCSPNKGCLPIFSGNSGVCFDNHSVILFTLLNFCHSRQDIKLLEKPGALYVARYSLALPLLVYSISYLFQFCTQTLMSEQI